jgi:hypothetical protein
MKLAPEANFQIAILAQPSDRVDELADLGPLEWLFCKRAGDHFFEFYSHDELVSSVDLQNPRFDLQNLVGIVVVGDADEFEAITNKWTSKLPSLGLTIRRIPKYDSKALLCAAIECIASQLALQRSHCGRAALALANYRQEFERLQRCFSRLEGYVGRQSSPRPTEIFEYPPDAAVATEMSGRMGTNSVAGQGGRSLIQYLPVDSFGVSSFWIHLNAKPQAGGRPLSVRLQAIETGHVFGAWSVGADDVPVGWVELALNQAIDESALGLTVIVEWPSDTSDWALTLGPPHPFKEFRASTEAGERLEAPLALRVSSSLPGVRVPVTTRAVKPVDAPQTVGEFIPNEVYGTVTQVFPPVEDDKILVSHDPIIDCITVHPRKGGQSTVGRMNVAVPRHAWRLSARIYLAHEHANPTQFALMVSASSLSSSALMRLDQLDASSTTFSGWRSLSALEEKTISVLIPESLGEQLSIHLLTRQAADSSPDFAWARFSRFEFNIVPKSITGESETGVSARVSPATVPHHQNDRNTFAGG